MTDRTDRERMAWCMKNAASIAFCAYSRVKGAAWVEVYTDSDEPGYSTDVYVEAKIRQPNDALDAWRRAVDAAMNRENA